MPEYIVFYAVFTAQVALLSIYFPHLILKRMRTVIKNYPPEQYPKLYPSSVADYKRGQRRYQLANVAVVILAIAMICWLEWFTHPSVERFMDELSIFFFMLQLAPMVMLEISEKSNLKAMRALNKTKKRSAELLSRNIFSFASPRLVTITLALIVLTIICDIYFNQHIHQFQFSWQNSTVERSLVLIVTNALLAVVGYFNIYSKKLDPHQDNADRIVQMRLAIRSLFYISIGMSIFFIVKEGTDDIIIGHMQAAITSAYCIGIGFFSVGSRLLSLNLKDINFDVYKESN